MLPVAVLASHIGAGVSAVSPVADYTGMLNLVAFNTGHCLLGHAALSSRLPCPFYMVTTADGHIPKDQKMGKVLVSS